MDLPRGAGHAIVPVHPTGNATRCAQWRCRAPPGGALLPGSPGNEAGRRRSIGVVAALKSTTRTTTPMGRRWGAEGGPEGRGRENPGQRQQQRPHPETIAKTLRYACTHTPA